MITDTSARIRVDQRNVFIDPIARSQLGQTPPALGARYLTMMAAIMLLGELTIGRKTAKHTVDVCGAEVMV